MAGLISSYRPVCEVTFFTETANLVARGTNDPNFPLDQDVVSVTTTRDMQADSPTFTIDLTNHKPWNNWIASNDLLVIKMSRPPETLQTVMVGLVDDCRKRTVVNENSATRVITVTGRSLAKAFIRFDIGVVPEAEYQVTAVGWLQSIGIDLAGSKPGDIVRAIWDKICTPHVNYKWSNGQALFDWLNVQIHDRQDLQLLDSSSIMNYQGSIYSLFKEVAEDPWYEVFFEADAITGKENFLVRPTPFNQGDWSALPSTTITDQDVLGDDLGRSDVETYTIFSVGAKSLFSTEDTYKTFGVLPYWYKPYADKYGNNRLHKETAYTSVASSSDAVSQTDTMKGMMKDLYNWNIKNNSMKNGTLLVKGSNAYKVGTRLIIQSAEDGTTIEYYITSVSQNFVNFGRWVTTLGVVRGLPPANRFSAPWDSYTEYSGMGIVPFDPSAARASMGLDPNSLGDGTLGVDFGTSSKVVAGATDVMNHGINGVHVHYVFGGNDPFTGSLDCSSFTQYIYRIYGGIDIGRTTGQQVTKGTQVSQAQAMPGDLVFFKGTYSSGQIYGVSHVGIYIGNNKMIDNGDPKTNVHVSDLSASYWQSHLLMFRRVLSPASDAMSPSSGGSSGTGGGTMFSATAYGASALNVDGGPGFVPTFRTATGTVPTEHRTIAVDKSVIPLYSLVEITCPDYPSVNGSGYVAEDVGGAIKGNRIDIYFDDSKDPYAARQRMLQFGKRNVYVKVLRRGKG